VLALPAGHRLARKHRLEWRDLHNEALVLIHPSSQHGFYDPFFAKCARAGAKPRPAQYANDIQTKMWLVSAGFGIAPTTATLSEVKRPGPVFRTLPAGLPPVQAVLAWRRDDHSPVLAHIMRRLRGLQPAAGLVGNLTPRAIRPQIVAADGRPRAATRPLSPAFQCC
jgi:DNA-binding transcriptional LysR family regulator